jgi:hypothetical protein
MLVAPFAGQMLAAPFAAPLAAYKKKQQTKKKTGFFQSRFFKRISHFALIFHKY